MFSDAKSELHVLVTNLEGNASFLSAGALAGRPGVERDDRDAPTAQNEPQGFVSVPAAMASHTAVAPAQSCS